MKADFGFAERPLNESEHEQEQEPIEELDDTQKWDTDFNVFIDKLEDRKSIEDFCKLLDRFIDLPAVNQFDVKQLASDIIENNLGRYQTHVKNIS
jgi:hypothetical protein